MAKINIAFILKIAIPLTGIIFAAGIFYALTGNRLSAIEVEINNITDNDIPHIEDDIDYHDDRLYETEREVFGIKKDIGSLSEKVDRNYLDQQTFQIEQKELSKEILKELQK